MGAPKANTTQHNIVEGGQVLKCNWDSKRDCQPIIFDDKGNIWVTVGEMECLCSNAAVGKQKGFRFLWDFSMVGVNVAVF